MQDQRSSPSNKIKGISRRENKNIIVRILERFIPRNPVAIVGFASTISFALSTQLPKLYSGADTFIMTDVIPTVFAVLLSMAISMGLFNVFNCANTKELQLSVDNLIDTWIASVLETLVKTMDSEGIDCTVDDLIMKIEENFDGKVSELSEILNNARGSHLFGRQAMIKAILIHAALRLMQAKGDKDAS